MTPILFIYFVASENACETFEKLPFDLKNFRPEGFCFSDLRK